ncbi:MAG: FMN-binding glutamate synthase family protein [Actinomycetes bacterium]
MVFWFILAVVTIGIVGLAVYDLTQRRHAILRNFPIIGHLRFMLERIGPELRQYIVTDNDHEKPFSRDERRWIYTSAKLEDSRFGFGTDNDLDEAKNYLIVKHVAFPIAAPANEKPGPDPTRPLPAAKVLGAARQRRHSFRPKSIINISGMSFGSLSGAAIRALNLGAARASTLHTTGEGGISSHHLQGGELVWQIGTGYFGCRDANGTFNLNRLIDQVEQAPVRAIELKLSQGAKPGLGGMLPGTKVTPEVAAIRGIPVGVDCVSPPAHTAFHDVDSLLEFAETIADATGLPVGIKSAVGSMTFWESLAERTERTGRGLDFITIDGGEGGTGAAPLVFTDHVSLPFRWGFSRVYRTFAERGLSDDIVFIGSARLGLPDTGLLAMALGCDLVNVGREAMLAIGCIQSQRCHTGQCPTGVATQSSWRQHGLDPTDKSVRCANYLAAARFELLRLARVCGKPHPALVTVDDLEVLEDRFRSTSVGTLFGYEPGWGLPSVRDQSTITDIMTAPQSRKAGL